VTAVGTVLAPLSPYLASKLLTLLLGCFVDDLSAFIVGTPAVLKGGLNVLR